MSLLLWCLFIKIVLGHFKAEYPPSRNEPNDGGGISGQGNGPCGSNGIHEEGSMVTTFNAGDEVVLKWIILNNHQDSPMRISLSDDGSDTGYGNCIILNNIPHPDTTDQQIKMKWTWTVPDLTCSKCSLRFEWFHGTNNNQGLCVKDTAVSSIWHSCSNIVINGKNRRSPARSEYTCYQPETWFQRNDNCNYFRSGRSASSWILRSDGYYDLQLTPDDGIVPCPYSTEQYNVGVNTGCNEVDRSLSQNSDGLTGSQPFAYGGKMGTGGVIAIILLVLMIFGLVIVYFIKKKRVNKNGGSVGLNDNNSANVVVDGNNTTN